ncbi:MAG: DUF952 domain-containing protein [Sphingomonas sp.]|nr:DUF952 domain-containing protein [Sphingomonas sp.]
MKTPVAYKVLTAEQMAVLEHEGRFAGAPIDLTDGFIHLSTHAQLTDTVDKHFAGQTGLWVASVDLEALGDAVKWEPSRGGQLFPHVYAPLPLSALLAYGELTRDDAGNVQLPVAG